MSEGDTFSYAGATVEVVDAAGILAAARAEPVELLRGAAWPDPVRRVDLRVSGGVFTAEIGTAGGPLSRERVRSMLLDHDPIGQLLAKRIEAGDPVTTKIVDGVGAVAVAVYRSLGLDRAGQPSEAQPAQARTAEAESAETQQAEARPGEGRRPGMLADAELGLQAEVTYDPSGTAVRLRAEVARDDVRPDHLRAFVGLTLQAVLEITGPDSLRERRYTVSRDRVPAGPVTTESVTLDQVGGLADVVAQLRQVALSFRHPEAMARWGARRPQGILMYGPPGTGKTMLSRALANEIGADFRPIRTPDILDKWLGGSERNIKQVFREARGYKVPTLMLFDEFDSIISYAGAGGDAASQAINAVAGIFKQEMNDLIEENPNVLVVATTNFPHRVDDSLIRSGRFDVKIAVPKPDEDGRADIFRKMIRDLVAVHERPGFTMFADDLDLTALARASTGMTGADIKEALRRVQLAKAMQDAHTGGKAGPITQQELLTSIRGLAG
jgi:transitional endoplasmic reticulum ATPase